VKYYCSRSHGPLLFRTWFFFHPQSKQLSEKGDKKMSGGQFSQERVDLVDTILKVASLHGSSRYDEMILYTWSLDCIEHAFLRLVVCAPNSFLDKIKDLVFQTLQCSRFSLLSRRPFYRMKILLEDDCRKEIITAYPIYHRNEIMSSVRLLQSCVDVLQEGDFVPLSVGISQRSSEWSLKWSDQKNEIQWQHERLEWILSVFKFSEHRFLDLLFDDGALPFPGQDDLPGRFSRVRMRSHQRPTRGEDAREHNHLRVHRRV